MFSQDPTTVTTSVSAARDVADWAVKSAGTQPSFYPLLLVAVLLCVIIGFGVLVWRVRPLVEAWIVAWRAEQEINRTHADTRLKAIREDAQGDNAAQRELAKVQQQSIVERIGERVDRVGGAVDKLTDRTERHGAVLASIAAKLGATVLAVAILLSTTAAVGYLAVLGLSVQLGGQAQPAQAPLLLALGCSPSCIKGFYCCSTRDNPNKCCEDKKGTAHSKSEQKTASTVCKPHSGMTYMSLATHADNYCNRYNEACL